MLANIVCQHHQSFGKYKEDNRLVLSAPWSFLLLFLRFFLYIRKIIGFKKANESALNVLTTLDKWPWLKIPCLFLHVVYISSSSFFFLFFSFFSGY